MTRFPVNLQSHQKKIKQCRVESFSSWRALFQWIEKLVCESVSHGKMTQSREEILPKESFSSNPWRSQSDISSSISFLVGNFSPRKRAGEEWKLKKYENKLNQYFSSLQTNICLCLVSAGARPTALWKERRAFMASSINIWMGNFDNWRLIGNRNHWRL